MIDPNQWDDPDWGWIEPIEFDRDQNRTWSTVTGILLGGVILGLIAAFWHIAPWMAST